MKTFKEFLDRPPLRKDTLTPAQLAAKYQVSAQVIRDKLAKGIEIELEHTDLREIAAEIALDHLSEDLEYYTKLAQVEPGNSPKPDKIS